MATPDATVDDYVSALLQLLPDGLFWRKLDDGTRLYHMLEGMAEGFVRLHNKGLDLIEEMDPRTATDMLENWEELLGLPEEMPRPIAKSTLELLMELTGIDPTKCQRCKTGRMVRVAELPEVSAPVSVGSPSGPEVRDSS